MRAIYSYVTYRIPVNFINMLVRKKTPKARASGESKEKSPFPLALYIKKNIIKWVLL